MPNVFTDTLTEKEGNAITGIMLLKAPFEEKKKGEVILYILDHLRE